MIHTFAAIYIGSYEVSIKIFEISGKKKIRDIDYIRSRIEARKRCIFQGKVSDMNLWRRCVIRLPSTKRSWTATGWTVTKRMLPQP